MQYDEILRIAQGHPVLLGGGHLPKTSIEGLGFYQNRGNAVQLQMKTGVSLN